YSKRVKLRTLDAPAAGRQSPWLSLRRITSRTARVLHKLLNVVLHILLRFDAVGLNPIQKVRAFNQYTIPPRLCKADSFLMHESACRYSSALNRSKLPPPRQ